MNLAQKDQQYLLQTYHKYPIELVRGKGSYLWDKKGKKYLDFYGGHAVCLLGHCPDQVQKAIADQSKKLFFYSNVFSTAPAILLAEQLAKTLAPHKYLVYFTNSGSEANETALKIARKFTGKKQIISFEQSFHGRGISALGATGIDSYHQFEPDLRKYTAFAKLGDLNSVKKAYNKDTAAIICEPIQSIGGVNLAPKTFYKELAAFAKAKKIPLLFDEVQTGLGRTGSFWFSQKLGVSPDVITTAKGLASGLPIAAVLVKESIAKTIKVGEHATTFGGGPLVCSAALATVKTLSAPKFLKSVREKSTYLTKKLKAIKAVEDVLGDGLLLGIKLKNPPAGLIEKGLQKGLIIGNSTDKKVFRIMPPLNISKKEIDQFINIFKSLLNA